MMFPAVQVFCMPKAGCTTAEYEDAYWVPSKLDETVSALRMAVADGATETSFSGLWARLLVRAYGKGRLNRPTLLPQTERLQKIWKWGTGKKSLPWYAEEKVRMGAFSSLLGVTVVKSLDTTEGEWEVLCAGDSCFFQVRGEDLLTSFPIGASTGFTSHPALLSSVPTTGANPLQVVTFRSGKWQAGDLLFLMTDAIACWFLKCWELRLDPVYHLCHLKDQEDFESFVTQQRKERTKDDVPLMKNDDVTLIFARLFS